MPVNRHRRRDLPALMGLLHSLMKQTGTGTSACVTVTQALLAVHKEAARVRSAGNVDTQAAVHSWRNAVMESTRVARRAGM